jgi:hypothetical protein
MSSAFEHNQLKKLKPFKMCEYLKLIKPYKNIVDKA